jgi:arginine decarboxylase
MRLRDAVDNHPLLSRYMRCLTTADLIPAEYRASGISQPLRSGLKNMIKAWDTDEFVLDPSRITIYIGATGIDGDAFKRSHLMDRYGVQINKTSRNTVLFMTTIGTSRSSVAYLVEVLVSIARDLDHQIIDMSISERAAHERALLRPTPEGDVRRAFYLSYNDAYCEYLMPEEVEQRVENGQQVVSANFVTPYPPGYPVLVFSQQILSFMRSLDTPEVHGYRPDLGYRVYVDKALEIAGAATATEIAVMDEQPPAPQAGPAPNGSKKGSGRKSKGSSVTQQKEQK